MSLKPARAVFGVGFVDTAEEGIEVGGFGALRSSFGEVVARAADVLIEVADAAGVVRFGEREG